MKPLPAQNSNLVRVIDSAMPSLPTVLPTPTTSYSSSNRRTAHGSVQRVYPWLLFASTTLAGVFCVMYLTKPFIQASQSTSPAFVTPVLVSKSTAPPAKSSLMPDKDRLPGEK
ncbi:MAG: hypothetical protein RLZZ214_3068, partial [Verrucomicrobiota bacterium]